jgi:hypothetical protein
MCVHLASPLRLVTYLETDFKRPEQWLRDWGIAISIPYSTAMLLSKTCRRVQKPRSVQFFFGELVQCVETARLLGVTLDTRLNRVGFLLTRFRDQRLGVFGPP